MRSERVGRTTDEAPVEPLLVVDVDGSLIGGDLLIEGIARLLSASPLGLFALPFRLAAAMMRGRAGLKRRIAEAVRLPPDTLAWNPAVLEKIAAAQAAGRSVWLASASDARAVSLLAETVGAAGCLASVVILTLYIQSPETGERYARPEFLWLVCPLLLYWLGRMALLDGLDEITHRHGGRVYLAKDARCAPERLREGYPRLGAFEAVRAEASGAPPRFASELSRRLAL